MAHPDQRKIIDTMDETMLRRVHPSQVSKDGRPSKTSFYPRPADNGLVSVDRSSVVTPSGCYENYVRAKALVVGQGGIWGVTVEECARSTLSCLSDPLDSTEYGGPNSAHALIDMTQLSEEQIAAAASKLYALAKTRGKLAP